MNEGKNQYEIGKDARISFTDIGVILNKAVEEKSTEGSKEKQDNDGVEKNHRKRTFMQTKIRLQTIEFMILKRFYFNQEMSRYFP